jgi:hypothetical protein
MAITNQASANGAAITGTDQLTRFLQMKDIPKRILLNEWNLSEIHRQEWRRLSGSRNS